MKHRLLSSLLLRNYFLLSLVIILVFIVQLLPLRLHDTLFDVFFTLIYISVTFTIQKFRKPLIITALVLLVFLWVSTPENLPALNIISKLLSILFFCFVVGSFIMMISRSKEVSAKVILESINGYLLMGIMFTLLIALVMFLNPASFSFPDGFSEGVGSASSFSNYMYYSLVTMSTLGYGDVLPTTPAAKSLATFISVSGQLYIAIIIAMLVGKFASQKH